MIKFRNLGEIFANLSVAGVQTAAAEKATFLVPFACQLKAIYAKLGTAGVTGNQICDINKNNTTIFANATKLTFATAVQAATYDVPTVNPTVFAKGDIITLDVDSIHSGTAAKNLNVLLVLQRLKGTGPVGTMVTDSIGPEAEL